MRYDFVIIGGGIAGCSVAHFLSKKTDNVLLLDRNSDVAQSASGAAGAFLSPLLGKPNNFKNLVTKALKFSTNFYKEQTPDLINNCGVLRIPKNDKDKEKFKSYIPYMDFLNEKSNNKEFEPTEEGCFFDIGSLVDSYEICKSLSKETKKIFNYEVKHIEYQDNIWIINNKIKAKNLILATGADTTLIGEYYFNIRAVWGQRIDIGTTTCITHNYHKECSVSLSRPGIKKGEYIVSIGATHHRFECDKEVCNYCLKIPNMSSQHRFAYSKNDHNSDTEKLLKLASDIVKLENIELLNIKVGARASSVDYFPMVGKLIDSEKTLDMYPYIKKGSKVPHEKYTRYKNLFVINGVGGRGFVLSPYLARILVQYITEKKEIPNEIEVSRLFKRWARKIK